MPAIKAHNDVLLTREKLLVVLHDLSTRLHRAFGHQVRLLIHGGAIMVLHAELRSRKSTRDIDYIHRAFVRDYGSYAPEAEVRLKSCIAATARAHSLGGDWMNAHADVALPMAHE